MPFSGVWPSGGGAATRCTAIALLASTLAGRPVAAQRWSCPHCQVGSGFEELLRPEDPTPPGSFDSQVHVLWPAHVEVVPITSDAGGWEPPSFHERLAREAIRGWRSFQDDIVPGLSEDHDVRRQLRKRNPGALNNAFFGWQKRLFEEEGDVEKSLATEEERRQTPHPDANSSWPEMCALPEYNRLRRIVDRLSRRYLARSGMHPAAAAALNYSIFNWAAVHGAGEFHAPHTHVGEYHVGVFYAQAGPGAGKLRFGDPRGHSPPFARAFFHTPRSGDLILFPSWLSHMATVTSPSSDLSRKEGEESLRVVFSFNIGPVEGPLPCHLWWSDPTGDMRFQRRSPIDPEALGL